VCEALKSLVDEVTYFGPYWEEYSDPPIVSLPEKSQPNLWDIHIEPTKAPPKKKEPHSKTSRSTRNKSSPWKS